MLANADVLDEAKAGLGMKVGSRTGDRLRSKPIVVIYKLVLDELPGEARTILEVVVVGGKAYRLPRAPT